jgi:Carboxypeptidase regulatory-like domain/TonB dependent receptor
MNRILRHCLAAILAVAACLSVSTAVLEAQVLRATILGTITDSTGAVVPGAQVVVIDTNTNTRRETTTNDSGFFAMANLEPGAYRVEAEHPGFRRIVRAGIDLTPNVTVRIDLELQTGTVSETVDVTASAPILQTDRSDTGRQIEAQQLVNIPLGTNRNYQGMLQLVPGMSKAQREHSEFYNSQDNLSNRSNGQERDANNFMIEGVDNNIETGSLTAIIPPIEAIQTVEISTSNYDPEFGRASGAVVNATLKSGTNDLHGGVFHFHKNDSLYAKDVFATTKAPTTYNQFGGILGGPIKRNKLFFFGDYQGSRDHKGAVELVQIPSMDFRTGDFSNARTSTGQLIQIYDPNTGNPDGTGRTPFAGNQIPTNRISPIAQRLLAFLPPTTRPGTGINFEKSVVRIKQLDQADGKIDYVATDNDRITGRYSYQKANVTDPGLYGPENGIYGGPHANGFQGYGPARSQSVGLSYSRVWSPTLVSELRGGLLRNRNDAFNWDYGTKASEAIGIRGANIDQWSSGLSEFTIAGGYHNPVLGYDSSLPWFRATTAFTLVNNWTKTLRNHVIKFGYGLQRYRIELQQTDPPRGEFEFNNGATALNGGAAPAFANYFAAFLLDRPANVYRGLAPVFPARRDWLHSLYVQDKWQVLPQLTLDLGLRWELWPSSKPRLPGGFANYIPSNNTLEVAGIGSVPMDLGVETRYKSFAPRLGLAYRINSKTVFRGGYGISYSTRFFAPYNFPVRQQNTYTAVNTFSAAPVTMGTGIPAPDFAVIPADGIIRNVNPTLTVSTVHKDLPHGYVQSWNFAVQRSLPGNFALEVAYVGNHVINESMSNGFNINAARPGTGPAGQPLRALYGRTTTVNTFLGMHQYYNGLQVKFDRRFSNGFQLTTGYSYAKTIDFDFRQNFNVLLDKGRSDQDRTHVFSQSYVYELPFGQGKRFAQSGPMRAILGGFQLSGIMLLQTGRPLNIQTPSAGVNAPGTRLAPADLVGEGEPTTFGNVGPGQKFFDVTRYRSPAPGTWGNVGRNTLTGPGVVTLDLGLFRKFTIKEGITLEFRAEAINATNTPHFANPGVVIGNADFGEVRSSEDFISSATDTDNRKVQFGMRLFF